MKKVVCFFICVVFLFSSKVGASYEQYINKSYIVMDARSNRVLEGNNIHLRRSVASVSKIMTAIIALENGALDKEIEIIEDDLKTYGSSIYLKEGNTLTLLDLVYGLMLRSGNDAALAIARAVGGSVNEFVSLMNEKAQELGMNNSYFNNPSGLDLEDDGNLSTSYDLALLMSYCLDNEIFTKIINTKSYKSEIGTWKNKNKLLTNYKYNLGGKTGFTDKAKRTLVTASKKEDTLLVVVTLDCGNDFNFHKFLYEANFEKYQSNKILEKGDNYFEEYTLKCSGDIYVLLEKENIEEYSLIYRIKEGKSEVYLRNNSEEKLVGTCLTVKNDTNKKEGIIRRLFRKIVSVF